MHYCADKHIGQRTIHRPPDPAHQEALWYNARSTRIMTLPPTHNFLLCGQSSQPDLDLDNSFDNALYL